jgi:two-component system, sensor histidine kinase and response regulator
VRRSPRHLPIIAVTANALESDREKCLQAGMEGYIAKPINLAELSEVLERWTVDVKDTELPPEGAGAAYEADDDGHSIHEDPLDPDVLAGLRELQQDGEPDLLAELVEMFVSDTGPRLAALRDAVESGDPSGVERTAHAMKGSAGNMGARNMSNLAADLEEIGASGDLAGAAQKLERLVEEYGRVRPALAELTKGG